MSIFLRALYTYWTIFWIALIFIILFPFYLLATVKSTWHKWSYTINKVWARIAYFLMFSPVRNEWRFKPQKKQVYVFCPNHFSFLDIPIMALTMRAFFVYVGKMDLQKVPLFGYMYRKIHIGINRDSGKSRYQTYIDAKEALDNGKNLVIYPEGGIWAKKENMPKMAKLKDGPFRIAIEKQVPIVPVTIPYNWKLLPYPNKYMSAPKIARVIYHEPISTKGMTLDNIKDLKQKYKKIVEDELEKYA